jgi:hypothetical protein
MATIDEDNYVAIYNSMGEHHFCNSCKNTMSELVKGKIHYGN